MRHQHQGHDDGCGIVALVDCRLVAAGAFIPAPTLLFVCIYSWFRFCRLVSLVAPSVDRLDRLSPRLSLGAGV